MDRIATIRMFLPANRNFNENIYENPFGALISGLGLKLGRSNAMQPSLSACNQDHDAVIGSVRQI